VKYDKFPSSWAAGLGHLGSHTAFAVSLLYFLCCFWQIEINFTSFLKAEVSMTTVFPVKNYGDITLIFLNHI